MSHQPISRLEVVTYTSSLFLSLSFAITEGVILLYPHILVHLIINSKIEYFTLF